MMGVDGSLDYDNGGHVMLSEVIDPWKNSLIIYKQAFVSMFVEALSKPDLFSELI